MLSLRIHIMAGKVDQISAENDEVYIKNLRYASKILQDENILGIIEPINGYSVPGYYMNSYDKGNI